MADISVTAASVAKGSDATVESGTAGAAITIGQVVYKNASTEKWLPAVTTNATTAGSGGIGMAITTAAADGQNVLVQTSGAYNPGGTLTVGEIYVVSNNAGGLAPEADNTTGDFVTVLGVATTASNLKLKPIVSGVAVP